MEKCNTIDKYEEKYIVKDLKKYLKEITIIKRNNDRDKMSCIIEETINLCTVLDKALKNAIDYDEDIEEELVEVIEQLILIIKCYTCSKEIMNEADVETVYNFKVKIGMLITEKIKDIKMLIFY